jgi:membrane-bound lytic murein transglycosylase F
MNSRARITGVAIGAIAIAVAMIFFQTEKEAKPHWHPWDGPTVQRDLADIADDTLRVLVLRDPLVWEERQRTTVGLEYELLQRFARERKMALAVQPFDHPDSLLVALWQGRGDIAAGQFIARREWKKHFRTSEPFASVSAMIARPRARDEHSPHDLPDSVLLSAASPFATAKGLAHAVPFSIAASGTEDDLLMRVVLGESGAAVISDLRAGHEAVRFPILEFTEAICPAQDLRFVVRDGSVQLLQALDDWLLDKDEVEARKHLLVAYTDKIPEPGPLRSRRAKGLRGDSLSPFDAHFREHASVGGWRWELLAAMAWKETRFDSTVTSSKGAMGIMQFMPNTAERMGLDSTSSMDDHIHAAARYLSRLDTIWLRVVPDKEQRLRFVLASYNAGPGHIIDAQRLAEHLGLDPAKWEDNVERAVLLLAKPRYFLRPEMKNGYCKGSQVFHYVRGVLTVYDQLRGKAKA